MPISANPTPLSSYNIKINLILKIGNSSENIVEDSDNRVTSPVCMTLFDQQLRDVRQDGFPAFFQSSELSTVIGS